MTIDLNAFTRFYDKLYEIDFTGTLPKVRPDLSTLAKIRAATGKGAPFLPPTYRERFYAPLDAALPDFLTRLRQAVQDGQLDAAATRGIIETYYAPIYQHGANVTNPDVRDALNRFLAVVSNLFRSFVNRNKRRATDVPLVTDIPPLAFFQSDSGQGPYTVTADDTELNKLGTNIGIVSLPATYRDHPLLWASLTHEVCGHDVVHADPELVPELVAGVRSMFTSDFDPSKSLTGGNLQALIWSYWMDEAVADAYGVLNMGPTFPFNLAGFFAALTAKFAVVLGHRPRPTTPVLSTSAGPRDPANGDNKMDEHPIDVLRLYLAIGVIESMAGLSETKRTGYVNDVEKLAKAVAAGATEVTLQGLVEVSHDHWLPVDTTVPFAEAGLAARKVGNLIATRQFAALNNHSIQDIETWDDADENTATAIANQILNQQSIVAAGDDAQLLAGATMAVVQEPELYDTATKLLVDALDDSYRRDPIWGSGTVDHMLAPARLYPPMKGGKPRGAKRGTRRPTTTQRKSRARG
jgi:hypothetical protein